MLYEFRSRATGSVTMIGKAAKQVLKIIGKSPDATGIITVAQIPAAIAALEQAAEREQPPADQPQDADDQNLQEDARERFVSLRQRVYPLIELIIGLLATGAWVLLVVWRVSRRPRPFWRPMALSSGGMVLTWLLLMTQWLPLPVL